jgi:hypothetical protein
MLIDEIKAIKSTKKDLRNFGLSVGGVLFVLGWILYWYSRPTHPYFIGAGAVLIVLGLVVPRVLLPLQKVWMGFAVVMGMIMTRVILSILFFVAFTFIGLLMKLLGKKLLDTELDASATSYWNYRDKEPKPTPEEHERQF